MAHAWLCANGMRLKTTSSNVSTGQRVEAHEQLAKSAIRRELRIASRYHLQLPLPHLQTYGLTAWRVAFLYHVEVCLHNHGSLIEYQLAVSQHYTTTKFCISVCAEMLLLSHKFRIWHATKSKASIAQSALGLSHANAQWCSLQHSSAWPTYK